MANQAIEQELNSYLNLLSEVQKVSVLNMIKSFFATTPSEQVSMQQYNQELNAAEQRISSGNFKTQSEVEIGFSKWKKENLK